MKKFDVNVRANIYILWKVQGFVLWISQVRQLPDVE